MIAPTAPPVPVAVLSLIVESWTLTDPPGANIPPTATPLSPVFVAVLWLIVESWTLTDTPGAANIPPDSNPVPVAWLLVTDEPFRRTNDPPSAAMAARLPVEPETATPSRMTWPPLSPRAVGLSVRIEPSSTNSDPDWTEIPSRLLSWIELSRTTTSPAPVS